LVGIKEKNEVPIIGRKTKIFFIAIGIFFFVQEITLGILRSVNIGSIIGGIITFSALSYSIIYIVVELLFFLIGFSILFMKENEEEFIEINDYEHEFYNPTKYLKRITLLILISGLFLLFWVIPVILASRPIFWTPYGYIIIWYFLLLLLNIASVFKLHAFVITLSPTEESQSAISSIKTTSEIDLFHI